MCLTPLPTWSLLDTLTKQLGARERTMRNVAVCALAALLLAGCKPGSRTGGTGGGGGGGGGGGNVKPPVSLVVTPATAMVALMPAAAAQGSFTGSVKLTATASYDDGS